MNQHAIARSLPTLSVSPQSQLLEDFARASSGWFWEMDAELRFTYMSESVRDVTGLAPEWHYGKTRQDLAGPEALTRKDFQAHLRALERREPFRSFIFKREGPDGIKWMESSGAPLFAADGSFVGYRGVATDVTARIKAEQRAEQLQHAIENMSEMFALWGPDDRMVMSNARFRQINTQVSDQTRPGTLFQDHIRAALNAGLYPEAAGREEDWFTDRLRRHRNPQGAFAQQRQDGRWVLLVEHKLTDGATVSICSDITEQKRSEQEIARKHQILGTAFRTIPDGVQLFDADQNMVAWNDRLFEVLDLDPIAVTTASRPGEAFRLALSERGDGALNRVDTPIVSDGSTTPSSSGLSYQCQLTSGRWIECRSNAVPDGGYLAIYRDISESKRLAAELERMANTDALTGIASRGHFFIRASEEFRRSSRYHSALSAMILDVDHFKSVNDTYGHAVGDKALKTIASIIGETVREHDLPGRIGGEEFAILLTETGTAGASVMAERLRTAIETAVVESEKGEFGLTVSIGVATLNARHASLEALMADADRALYRAKHAGRNQVVLLGPVSMELGAAAKQ